MKLNRQHGNDNEEGNEDGEGGTIVPFLSPGEALINPRGKGMRLEGARIRLYDSCREDLFCHLLK